MLTYFFSHGNIRHLQSSWTWLVFYSFFLLSPGHTNSCYFMLYTPPLDISWSASASLSSDSNHGLDWPGRFVYSEYGPPISIFCDWIGQVGFWIRPLSMVSVRYFLWPIYFMVFFFQRNRLINVRIIVIDFWEIFHTSGPCKSMVFTLVISNLSLVFKLSWIESHVLVSTRNVWLR